MQARPDESLPPAGIRLVADAGLRRSDGGRTLIGGAPMRIIRLSDAGAAVVGAWIDGTRLADVRSARTLARRLIDAGVVHPVVDPVDAIDVTVVVPVKDDVVGLGACLASLGDVATVVVDDASLDPGSVAAVAAAHGARLVRRDDNGGPGAARMSGLAVVSSALVAFIDSDVEAWPGWLDHLVAHFDDGRVVAVAPRVRSRPGATLRDRYESEHSPLDIGERRALVAPGNPISYVPTAAFVARVAAIEEVGGFDPTLRVGEDVDLVWRLIDHGGAVRYDPDVEVVHCPRPGWIGLLQQRRSYGRSAADLGTRHGSRVAPARVSPWSAAAWGALVTGHPVMGIGVAIGSSAALVPKLESLPDPVAETARLAGRGHLQAGRGLARAVARVWWPMAALLALVWPRLRPALAAALVVPPVIDWVGGARPTDPVRSVGLRIIDDLAYGVGVWEGVIRARDITAVTPDLVDWPGGREAVESTTVAGS